LHHTAGKIFIKTGKAGRIKTKMVQGMRSLIQYIPLKIILICLVLRASGLGYSQSGYPEFNNKNCHTYIYIGVESNVNQFSFLYSSLNLPYIWQPIQTKDTGYLEISFPVKDFKASNPLMYNDFLKLLKANEYPVLKICISNYQLENVWRDPEIPFPEIRITLAGISRTYEVDCSLNDCDHNLFISGATKIRLTDFDISPPAKLNGLVKVRDEIDVNFGLIITFAESNSTIALH
jgi:hypothetical protein